MRINFISSNDLKEIRTMHTKSDNMKIMIVKQMILLKNFSNLCKNIKKRLEELTKEREFVFDSVDLLYYHLHKIR